MSVLTLRLAGPLQSWGSSSRFTQRMTEHAPTKSGILGLLAAAQGRRRSDPIEDLLDLTLAVRVDQQGRLLRDFHTAHHQLTGDAMPLTDRYYWSDAVFTAYLGGPEAVLEGLHDALRDPKYPLYLGRRSCVPSGLLCLEVRGGSITDALMETPWQAGPAERRRRKSSPSVRLAVQADQAVYPDLVAARELNDVPVDFNPEHRQYRSRVVVETQVVIPTSSNSPDVDSATAPVVHDPMALLGGQ